ncbi:MAG TPA: ATP-dependent DNA ligase [Casimicrobiaceae bacterium]|nr:ATP-dependent DNA ligase [Casimicrobiaceae bacterium]
MRFAALVATSERVAQMSGRKSKIGAIAELLRALAPHEIAIAVAYLSGEMPHGRKGIGYALIRDATTSPAGEATLEISDIDRALRDIVSASGPGSVAERISRLRALLERATDAEQSFLMRLVVGELRQGALEGLMVDAVALAAQLPVSEVRKAAMLGGGIAKVAQAALVEGIAGLARYSITLFQPLAPMLAQPADDIEDALSRVTRPALEWKLDGARVQVHKQRGDVRIFSRTGNDVTAAAPEIVEVVRGLSVETLILDGEAIALRADGTPYPFQDTMRRFGRVLDIDAMRATMPLSVHFFDCLRLDDEDLIAKAGADRVDAMNSLLPEALSMPRLVTDDRDIAQRFYDDTIRLGHEGVMVKSLAATYEPGSRSAAWLKVKRAHTLDLVVLAAEWGHGRRKGWLSNLHLGARDPAGGGFVMLGKTFKGMTDAMLEWQTKELLSRAIERNDWVVEVRPELVVEITFNDLQASPRYPGGLALRFARVKGYRTDKRAEDADTIETVRGIYAAQGPQ